MGEELVVNIDGVQAFGTVVWSDQGEAGIEFELATQRGRRDVAAAASCADQGPAA